MRVAVSTDNGYVSPHFGRCPLFTIVDIEDGKVVSKEVINNPGHQPGAIPKFLHNNGAECIICGGMGAHAQEIFKGFGIQTIIGVEGKVDDIIDKVLKGVLESGESLCEHGAGKGYGLDKDGDGHHNGMH